MNSFPLLWGLKRQPAANSFDLIQGTPTELNRQLVLGRLDISPVSSAAYAAHHRSMQLLPDLSISCKGSLQSVLLFSHRPAERLDGELVSLDPASATSVMLLKILLRRVFRVEPRYTDKPEGAVARLLIGDPALASLWKGPGVEFVYDLGEEWVRLTGRPMVFAVWAARTEFASRYPSLVESIGRGLRRASALAKLHSDEVAREAAVATELPFDRLKQYFGLLDYRLGQEHREALTLFFRLAAEEGLLSPDTPELETKPGSV